jgi:hypothetical protein
MRKFAAVVLGGCVVMALASALFAEPMKVTQEEARAWIAYTIPLPKAIEITGKVKVDPANVAIVPPSQTDQVTLQTVKDLQATFGISEKPVAAASPEFIIRLEIGGSDAEQLKPLNNADQASRIYVPEGSSNELRIAALSPRGLFYAAHTLIQLVRAKKTDGSVEIPLMTVTDWPDTEDRGLWGADPYRYGYLGWLGDIKINELEQICNCGMDGNGKAVAMLGGGKESLLDEAPRYGIKFAPIILHLEQGKGGVFEAHPEYKAVDSDTDSFCYSQPGVVDLIADWMVQLASLPNVTCIDQWMTENLAGAKGCQCPGCKGKDRNVMEYETIIKAWEKARATTGRDIGLYILSSEETEHSNEKILAVLPKEVRFWYYHSLLSYNTSEVPMVRPYLKKAAENGQWIGICPNLCSIVEFYQPFTAPQFFKARMKEFADKKLRGVLGFPAPLISFVKFGIEGEAEWSWNSDGRTPKEFAYSYAVRHGMKDPALFADWTETLGPVSWDIYGSEWPSGEVRGCPDDVAFRLRDGKLEDLGYVLWETYYTPWGDIKNVRQLDDDVAAAEKAVELARKMGIKEYWYESLMIEGYIKSLKGLHGLRSLVKNKSIADDRKDEAKKYFHMYISGLIQARDQFPRWEAEVDKGANRNYGKKPMAQIDSMIDQMIGVAKELGVMVSRPL